MEIRSSPNYIWYIKDVLGQGATGAVYKGRHKKTGDVFAVKTSNHLGMMRPVEVRKREFDVLSKLNHENIVKIYASETELRSQNEIIVMEICPGGSLFTMLEHPSNAYGFSEQECIHVIRDVVGGMKHLHDKGMIHRDLKPGNIMRVFKDDGSCVYKLTDFGAARELMPSDQFVSIYGTEEYLHPDLYERGVLRKISGKTFGAQVDLWSIGVTFYHIATGKLPFRPFGGRQNKETMYHITTQKKSGMIAGVQKTERGDVEWTDKLPEQTLLSQGFKDLLTPILAGVLESDPTKMMSFDRFFLLVQDMISRKVIDVYSASSSTFHKVYIRPTETFIELKEMISRQTSVPSNHQELFYNFELFHSPITVPASKFPDTSRNKPVILTGGLFAAPDRLLTRMIPKVALLQPEWTLEGDAAAAKTMANAAYFCENTVVEYSDCVKVMADAMDTILKDMKLVLLDQNVICKEVEAKRMFAQQLTAAYCASQESVLSMLMELASCVHFTAEEKIVLDHDILYLQELITMKRNNDETLARESSRLLTLLKADLDDGLQKGPVLADPARFSQLANRKPLLPFVSTYKTRIEETYNRFRKEKHQRRLSHSEEQNHIFDRKKLSEDWIKVADFTRDSSKHRADLHSELAAWFGRVIVYKDRHIKPLQQCEEIQRMDDQHMETMKKFQEESQAVCRRIVQRIRAAMASLSLSSASVGTDPPSMAYVNGVTSRQEPEDTFWLELDNQITGLSRVTEVSKATALENTEQLKQLTSSFTEFFQVIDESGRRSLQELQRLTIETQ